MKYKLQSKPFSEISDDDLLRRLTELLTKSRRVEAELVAHIGEVDARRLFASKASSMFVYSTEVLHLSEHEAYLRITVARAARKHPILLEMLSDGRLHLSGIAKLVPLLTETNCETLLARAAHQSKRKIEELVAELSPKPDVPAAMRKLPVRGTNTPAMAVQLGPDRAGRHSQAEREHSRVESTRESLPAPVSAMPAVVKPIAAARWKVQFTASNELREKLDRLRALMRSSVPDGDLATIIEEAVTEKLERLEAKRFAKTKAPRKSLEETKTSPSSRYIPAAVKRAVCERDQRQCTFVTEDGRRCREREGLEFHHRKPYGRGGDHSVDNICLLCRCHNGYLAERDYGKEVIERYRRSSSAGRVSEPAAVYAVGHRAFDLLGPDRVVPSPESGKVNIERETRASSLLALAPARPAVVKPIAAARWKVQFTASAELHDKLDRLRALMRSSVPDGDLATIIEEAVAEKLERLEAKRFAKTKAPRKSLEETNPSPSSRYIPAAVKRAVCERDQRQCTFVTEDGRRCGERERLEFHHRTPYGRGGDHSVDNISLLCRAHNGYLAERDYGKAVMGRYRRSAGRVSEPAAVYAIGNRAHDLLGPDRARLRVQAAEAAINGP